MSEKSHSDQGRIKKLLCSSVALLACNKTKHLLLLFQATRSIQENKDMKRLPPRWDGQYLLNNKMQLMFWFGEEMMSQCQKNNLSKGLGQNNSDVVTRIIFARSTWAIPKKLLKNAFETLERWKTIYSHVPECLKIFKALSSFRHCLAFTKHSLKELSCVLMLPPCLKSPIYFNWLSSLWQLFYCSESLQNWSRFLPGRLYASG